MLAVFIQNHLTRFSIDFPTEGPVGKKQTLCCGVYNPPTLLPQNECKGYLEKRHGCLLVAVTEMAISHRGPQELHCHCKVAMEHVALKVLQASSVLYGAGAVWLWERFCLVKMLKSILHSIDIYVFLSHL